MATSQDTSAAVDAFMRDLEHPFKAEIQALRKIVLGASDGIAEGVKWLAKDRAMIQFTSMSDLSAKASALQAIVRQWVERV